MSNNTVRARLAFSFRGEIYERDSVIDLDGSLGEPGEASNFHRLLARAAGIDPYSYLYEVLEAHEIAFSDATGGGAKLPRWPVRLDAIRAGPGRGTGLAACQGHRATDAG